MSWTISPMSSIAITRAVRLGFGCNASANLATSRRNGTGERISRSRRGSVDEPKVTRVSGAGGAPIDGRSVRSRSPQAPYCF